MSSIVKYFEILPKHDEFGFTSESFAGIHIVSHH